MRPRVRAYAITIILGGLVASPLFGAFAGDSFPISTFPMFATARSSEISISHVVLVGSDGAVWVPPPSTIANDEVLQAQETVRQALEAGERGLEALCGRVASRVDPDDAVEVRIVTSTYDALDYASGDLDPIGRRTHAACAVAS